MKSSVFTRENEYFPGSGFLLNVDLVVLFIVDLDLFVDRITFRDCVRVIGALISGFSDAKSAFFSKVLRPRTLFSPRLSLCWPLNKLARFFYRSSIRLSVINRFLIGEA